MSNIKDKIESYKEKIHKENMRQEVVLEMVERLQNLYNWYSYEDNVTEERDGQTVVISERRTFFSEDDEYKWKIVEKEIENLLK